MVPLISIIIPAYQTERSIADCLDSIFAQSFREYEIIVVNDGSTDRTGDILEHYRDRITILTQENRGRQATRNRGARHAHGAFLLFCDADIVLRPDCLAAMLHALTVHPEAAYAYSSFMYGWKKFRSWAFSAERLRTMNYIHTTTLIRQEYFSGFDESVERLQDWDLWLTMLERGHRGVWIPDYLFRIRTHRGGLSSWLPAFAYTIPWQRFGIRIARLERYRVAEQRIREKHHLPTV